MSTCRKPNEPAYSSALLLLEMKWAGFVVALRAMSEAGRDVSAVEKR
jgi:hypothetical protein